MPDSLVSKEYFSLVRRFPLRKLRGARDHRDAIKVYRSLVHRASGTDLTRGEEEYLAVLVDLIVDFEKRSGMAINTENRTAADVIRFCIEERGTSVHALAMRVGITPSNLSEMLSGKRDWSKRAIAALTAEFPIDPRKFLARHLKAA